MLPLVPVTIIGYVPVAAVDPTVMVMLVLPEPVIEFEPKVTVTPVGCPEADKVIAESKPLRAVVVMLEEPLLPCTTETEVGDAEMVNVGELEAGARALIRFTPFGLPQPVTRSKPVVAE